MARSSDSHGPRGHVDPVLAAEIRAVTSGDAAAIDAFCRREHPAVYRLCLGFLACATEAEDAAQDAMLRLLDVLPQYDADRPFMTWRNRVVLNLCRDRLRQTGRRRAAERAAAEREGDDAAPVIDPLARAELRATLTRALTVLPQREREAFVLRELEGNGATETGRVMGIHASSVRSLTTLARRRLRTLLAATLDPELPELPGGARCG